MHRGAVKRRGNAPYLSDQAYVEATLLEDVQGRFRTVRHLLQLLWEKKLWWMAPMVLTLVVVGLLLVFAQGSAVAPFVYTLF